VIKKNISTKRIKRRVKPVAVNHVPTKDKCKMHGNDRTYLFSLTAKGYLCLDCAKAGMFIETVTNEILEQTKVESTK